MTVGVLENAASPSPRQVGFAIWLVWYLEVYNGREGQPRDRKSSDQKTFSERKNIVVPDHSMIMHTNGYEIYEVYEVLIGYEVFVRRFLQSKVRCMKDHIKSSMRVKLDHIVLPVGANYLNSDKGPNLTFDPLFIWL